jgi:hypothetical protein
MIRTYNVHPLYFEISRVVFNATARSRKEVVILEGPWIQTPLEYKLLNQMQLRHPGCFSMQADLDREIKT